MWFGFAMGYAYHYGFFRRIECGVERATRLESKFPFNRYAERAYFITAGNAMGGTITASSFSGPMGMGGGSTASETNADNEATATAGSNSAQTNFKAFGGKGVSIGGTPIEAPRFDSQGASASRGRSTPATRAAAAASSGNEERKASERPGNALIAKLEEKKRMEKMGDSGALTTHDVGHSMQP